MRRFIVSIILLFAPIYANPGDAGQANSDASSAGLQIVSGPYLQAVTGDSATIVWRTNRRCVSHVLWGSPPAKEQYRGLFLFGSSKAQNSRHGLIDADTTLHKIRIDGLSPRDPATPFDTLEYKVVSREIVNFGPYKVDYGETVESEAYRFSPLNKDKTAFSFIVLNDRHEKVEALTAALKRIDWKNVDLVLLNGDMLNHLENEAQVFKSLVDPCVAAFAKEIPFVFVRGNHEARGAFARRLIDYFPTPTGQYYYSFDHGPVHFTVMDSGEDKIDSSEEYSGLVAFDPYREEQARWLEKEIRGKAFRKARFRVVLSHMPPFGGNNWHGEQRLRELWVPLLEEGKIDLLLCGHTHRYKRLPADARQCGFPIVINDVDTAIRMDVTRDRLTGAVTRDNGEAVDTFTVERRRTLRASLYRLLRK